MTREEAKLILQAYRPSGEEAGAPFFAEALALVSRDPELAAWWQAEQEFDRRVAAKLGEVPIPADLRDRLLASKKIVSFQPSRGYWISAAIAAVLVGLLVANFHAWTSPAAMTRDDYTASVMPYIQNEPALDMTAAEQAQVMAWLKKHQSPTGPIPPGMANLPTLGCEKLAVHGQKVSLICFQNNGHIVHLFVINDKGLMDPPGPAPEWGSHQGWSTAAWTADHMSFVMATRAGPETLKTLLGQG